ncbi:hypothetical protein FACS1894181_14670 [Bacteroidia bacterium]|nr:hypothetical protein FACS1894181_14670 [Bacteroidia bacterium]
MKNFKVTYYIAFFVISMLALSSCVNDDLSKCVIEKRVFFDYTPATKAIKNGINPDDMVRMNLFVFDRNGRYVREYVDEQPALSPKYNIDITGLEPGNYQFVAWGNLENQYALSPKSLEPGLTNREDLQVELTKLKDSKTVSEWLNPLFFATHTELKTIEILYMVPQDIHLKLIENTYKINVEVIGFDSISTAENTYRVEILDNNGIYTFDNDFAPCEDFNYASVFTVLAEENYKLKASLMVLRLAESRPVPVIRLVNNKTNVELIRENLVELILAAKKQGATVDFDNTLEFEFRFEFNPNAPLECNVYINGFQVVNQGGVILD